MQTLVKQPLTEEDLQPPFVDPDLIAYLRRIYPDRVPDCEIGTSMETVALTVTRCQGQQDIIDLLESIVYRQNTPDEV